MEFFIKKKNHVSNKNVRLSWCQMECFQREKISKALYKLLHKSQGKIPKSFLEVSTASLLFLTENVTNKGKSQPAFGLNIIKKKKKT